MELKRIATLIASGAAVVAGVLGLFGAFLKHLVPPVSSLSPLQALGLASLASLLLLFLVVLKLPARPSSVERHRLAAVAAKVGLGALVLLFIHMWAMNTFVFAYPPAELGTPELHVRGTYTSYAKKLIHEMTLSGAIRESGGLEKAEENEILWTEESRKNIELMLTASYTVSIALFSLSLFILVVTAISARRAQ
ncbi:hypothetical protein [Variovorax sp. YR216]|uniref:hypothetical protein n=1 Tax=Variovorax sp. YR216 TaxID=1882828 RepID=UPI00089B0C86|nr:hypothetical protein [Variovorax sp. YR216]SEB10098.1 hypothetical protein SAMN05444680_107245 [Variovorax sp. YR216]